MSIELIDSHTHLTAPDFSEDLADVIKRAADSGVKILINIGAGYGAESAKKAVEISEMYSSVKASVGIHPHNAQADMSLLQTLNELALNKNVVAIGETGLDFFRDWSPKENQETWFRAQVELAIQVGKPLIIHSRSAAEECFNILSEMKASQVGGVFHCFAEDEKFAERLCDINFLVSFPGSITFKKADKLREIARKIPLEQIMLETDAPYMAPEPYRGKRCESSFLLETARALADIKGMSLEEVAEVTTKTAKSFFKI